MSSSFLSSSAAAAAQDYNGVARRRLLLVMLHDWLQPSGANACSLVIGVHNSLICLEFLSLVFGQTYCLFKINNKGPIVFFGN
jgi:hypothetical protein